MDRRSEIVQSSNRYNLSLGSNKSTGSAIGETGTYDVTNAELKAKNEHENIVNNNVPLTQTISDLSPYTNGNSLSQVTQTNGSSNTLETNDGELKKKKWPTDQAYFLAKEILMTERTYKKDLEVINTVKYSNLIKTN